MNATLKSFLIAGWLALAMAALGQGSTNTNNIVRAAYYFDDPNAPTNLWTYVDKDAAGGPLDSLDEEIEIEYTVSLPIGWHTNYVRMQSAAGVWSTPRAFIFEVTGDKYIKAAEYFFNTDPGPGNGTRFFAWTPGAPKRTEEVFESLEIPTDALRPGLHTNYVRAQDQNGDWGPARAYVFQVLPKPVVASAEYLITDASVTAEMLRTDTNYFDRWLPMNASTGSAFTNDSVNVEADIDTAKLPRGAYKAWIRSRDEVGRVTAEPQSVAFDVTKQFPWMDFVGNQMMRPGSLFTMRPALPEGASGTFSLAPGFPGGMTVNPVTGEISWTPPAGSRSTNFVTLLFTDTNAPPTTVSRALSIFVEPEPGDGPVLVRATAFQNGGKAALLFSEPLDPAAASNVDLYRVGGVKPQRATLRYGGIAVILESPAISSAGFEVVVNGMRNALGTAAGEQRMQTLILDQSEAVLGAASEGSAASPSKDRFDVYSNGSGMRGASDEGRFIHEAISGNFDIRAQISTFRASDYGSEAGLVARESTASDSRSFAVVLRTTAPGPIGTNALTPFHVVSYGRTSTGQVAAVLGQAAATLQPPAAWVRLVRDGAVLRSYYGTNGTAWVLQAEHTNAWATRLEIGLVTASGGSVDSAFATFQNYGSLKPRIVSSPTSQTLAAGSTVTFGVVARGAESLSYRWYFNDSVIAGATTDTLRITNISLANVGNYRAEVSNTFGNEKSAGARLDISGANRSGVKGDVSPRPYGNNAVTVADWVQVGRFVVKLDTPSEEEKDRSDTAEPAGVLTVGDWVKTGRLAVGLDQPGLTRQSVRSYSLPPPAATRIRAGSMRVLRPGLISVPVVAEGPGGANALAFSLGLDPGKARLRAARLGAAAQAGTLVVNSSTADSGSIGMMIGMPFGAALGGGQAHIASIEIELLAAAAMIDFQDAPVMRELVDAEVQPLAALWQSGAIAVAPEGSATLGGSEKLELSFAAEPGRAYIVETSADLVNWRRWLEKRPAALSERLEIPAPNGVPQQFYRVRPAN